MSLTITEDMMRLQQAAESMGYVGNSATTRMMRQVEEITRIQEQMEAYSKIERAVRQADEIRKYASGVWHAIHEAQRRAFDQVERFRQQMALIERLRREVQIVRHRGQDGATGKVKVSSAKKSTKSATNGSSGGSDDGGDGGGDGDGPQRTRSTSKKSRSSKSVITRPPRLPSASPGKTAPTPSPKVSPNRPEPSRVIAIFAMLLLFGISLITSHYLVVALIVIGLTKIALTAMGYPDVAKEMWISASKLLKQPAKGTDEESESPSEGD